MAFYGHFPQVEQLLGKDRQEVVLLADTAKAGKSHVSRLFLFIAAWSIVPNSNEIIQTGNMSVSSLSRVLPNFAPLVLVHKDEDKENAVSAKDGERLVESLSPSFAVSLST